MASLPALSQSPSQREPELNEFGFLFRKSQELADSADLPARSFESLPLGTSHRSPHVFVVEPQSTPAIVNHRLWRRGRFLSKSPESEWRRDRPDRQFARRGRDPESEARGSGERSLASGEMRKPKSLALLKSSEQVASLDSRVGGERRSLDFAL